MNKQELKEQPPHSARRLARMTHQWNKLPTILRDIIEAVAAVIIIIIILKITLGSKLLVPIVVVISGSMLHEEGDDSWRTWLNTQGVTDEQISTFPLQGGFAKGDMIVTMRPTVKLGDVVIYEKDSAHNSHRTEPIIHRIVGIATIENDNVLVEGTLGVCGTKEKILNYAKNNKDYVKKENSDKIILYITKGDNNEVTDQCGNIAFPVSENQLLAKTFVKIPKIGYLKLCMLDPFHCLDD